MPRLLGKDAHAGASGSIGQAATGPRGSPLLRSLSSPAPLTLRTTDTSAQPHQLQTAAMRAGGKLQQSLQQQTTRSQLALETQVIGSQEASEWARQQQERSEQRSLQRAASQRANASGAAATSTGSGSDPMLDDADDEEPPTSADDKMDGPIMPFQPPNHTHSPDPPASTPAAADAQLQKQQSEQQQLEEDAREEMNEGKYADETEANSAMYGDSASARTSAPSAAASFSSLFSSYSATSQSSCGLPSLSQMDMGGSQADDPGWSQSQSQSQSQTMDSTPPLAQPTHGAGATSSMHLSSFLSDSSSSKLAFHQPPAPTAQPAAPPTRTIASLAADLNQKTFQKQQRKLPGRPLLAVNKPGHRPTPPAPMFDGTPSQQTPPLQQVPKQYSRPPPSQSQSQLAPSQPPLPQQQAQQHQPQQPHQLARSQSATSSADSFFSFSQPVMSSHTAPAGGGSAASAAAPLKNHAHRTAPSQHAPAPKRRSPLFSRLEIKAQQREEYKSLYPLLVRDWKSMEGMKHSELKAVMVGQGGQHSKYNRGQLLEHLLKLAREGRLKPPADKGANDVRERKTTGSTARFATQPPEEADDSPDEEAASMSQGAPKRHKANHVHSSAHQWQQLAAQRSRSNAHQAAAGAAAAATGAATMQPRESGSAIHLDLAARSTGQQPWAGAEVVVSVDEYLRFRCAHQFALDKLAQFKSDAVNPRGHRPSLLQLGGSSGLVRARVLSLLPIIEADFYGRNEHANHPPPTPWCSLVLQVQQDDTQPANGDSSLTICYLDANWTSSDEAPHTRQQLCAFNTAPFLFEASFFEQRMAREWSVGDLFEAVLLRRNEPNESGESNGGMAAGDSEVRIVEVRRIGRIIDIQAQAPTPLQASNQQHSPYRCLHVLWLTAMEDGTLVIDLWNQDIRTVSPWEIQPAPSSVRLAACQPPPQIKQKGPHSDLDRSISSTLHELYQLVWRVLWLPSVEVGSQSYFSRLLGTPTNRLALIRQEFSKVCERHSLRVYAEWSLFESDLRELVHMLHSGMHAHLDCHDGDDVSALIPPLVQCADEATLPLPPRETDEYVSAESTMQRMAAEQQLALQWRQQCPAATGQVMAAIILIIETALLSNPTWMDSFGRLHISPMPVGVEVAPQASRLKIQSYRKLSRLMQNSK